MDMPSKLELGCGQQKPEGFFGVDKIDTEATDKVMDLDDANWDLPSDYFSTIRAINLFEHLENPVDFMEEVFRVAAPGAKIVIQAPHRSSQNWTDPTHKRLCGINTMKNYFCDSGQYSFYSDCQLTESKTRITFHKGRKLMIINPLVEYLVNYNGLTQWAYEKTFVSRLLPAKNVVFELRSPNG
jgi:SAM-dependent methyltransferase